MFDILNTYVYSIFNWDEARKYLPEFKELFSHIVVSEKDVLDIVSMLDVNKAVGPESLVITIMLLFKLLCLLFHVFIKYVIARIFQDKTWQMEDCTIMLYPYSKFVTRFLLLTTGPSPYFNV